MARHGGPTTERLAICLIIPADADTYGAACKGAGLAGLPSLAALTPAGHSVTLLYDRGETLDWARLCTRYDVIALTGTLRQRGRLLEILGLRRGGAATICVAGPILDDDESSLATLCNVRFVGPLEETWPRFIDDLAAGRRPLRRYRRPAVSWLRTSWAAVSALVVDWPRPHRPGAALPSAR